MNKALFAQSAQADLLEAWLFIAEDDLGAADRVLDGIETESKMLATQPLMGCARPELADGVRSWPTSTAYILFYLAGANGITVLRVLHHGVDSRVGSRIRSWVGSRVSGSRVGSCITP